MFATYYSAIIYLKVKYIIKYYVKINQQAFLKEKNQFYEHKSVLNPVNLKLLF